MKTNFRLSGPCELEATDLANTLIHWAKKSKANQSELTKMITNYLIEVVGYTAVHKIQRNEDLSKIVADVEAIKNEGGSYIGVVKEKPVVDKASNKGFERKNVGFYSFIREMAENRKNKGIKTMTFEEIKSELSSEYDKDMDKKRIKQYLAPSQIKKNAKDLMRGISRSKDGTGLSF